MGGRARCDGEYEPRLFFTLSCSCRTEPKGKFDALIKDLLNYSEITVIACLLTISSPLGC